MIHTTMQRFAALRPFGVAALLVASGQAAWAQTPPEAQQPSAWQEGAPPLPPAVEAEQAPAVEPEEPSPARPNEDQDEEEGVDGAEESVDVTVAPEQPAVPMTAPASSPTLAQFQDELSPYGTWINDPDLGLVWQPSAAVVGTDFQPYVTGGSWVTTSVGWGFQSDWSWGWAPFHYGRWYRHARWGWLWWPQYTWGPAWVDWRTCGTHVAWAPLGPPGFRLAFGLGVPGWSFVSYGNFRRPGIAHYAYEPYHGGEGWGWRHFSGWRSEPVHREYARNVLGGWNAPTSHGARPVGSGGSGLSSPNTRPSYGRTWSTTVTAPPPGRSAYPAPGSRFGAFSGGRSEVPPPAFHGGFGRSEVSPPAYRGGFGGRTEVAPPAYRGGFGGRTEVAPPAYRGGFGGRTEVAPPAFHGGFGGRGSTGFGGRTEVSPPAFHGGSFGGGGVPSGGGQGGFHGGGSFGGSHGGGGGGGFHGGGGGGRGGRR